MSLEPSLIALIGTIFGGVGIKVISHWLGKNKVKTDDARQIRDELRIEINSQKQEIRDLESNVNMWRTEYYDLRDKYAALQTELTLSIQNIKQAAAASSLMDTTSALELKTKENNE